MNYKISAPIEMRSSLNLGRDPEYIIRAKIKAGIPDNYGNLTLPDGSKKVLRSIFTENCIKSMDRQAKTKKITTDVHHVNGVRMNIQHWLDEAKIDPIIKENILNTFQMNEMPMFKLNEMFINPEDSSEAILDIRGNPHFRKLGENEAKYFDAVWKMIQDQFINKVSFDFAQPKLLETSNPDIPMIDDLIITNVTLTAGGSLPENEIFQVAMRAAQDYNGGKTMDQEAIDKAKVEIEEQRKSIEQEKLKMQPKIITGGEQWTKKRLTKQKLK